MAGTLMAVRSGCAAETFAAERFAAETFATERFAAERFAPRRRGPAAPGEGGWTAILVRGGAAVPTDRRLGGAMSLRGRPAVEAPPDPETVAPAMARPAPAASATGWCLPPALGARVGQKRAQWGDASAPTRGPGRPVPGPPAAASQDGPKPAGPAEGWGVPAATPCSPRQARARPGRGSPGWPAPGPTGGS